MDYFIYFFKISIILPIILLLIYITMKVFLKFQYKSKYIKVIDKVQVAPNSFLVLVEILNKTYIILTSNSNSQILTQLDDIQQFQKVDEEFKLKDKINQLIKKEGTE